MKMNKEVVMVRISDIIPNRFQPRLTFDEEALNDLANSIKEHGIIQPLILRDLGSKYEIIAGERRYKASTIAGLTEVPAIVGSMDDQTSAELALIENIQRKDLTAIEEAKSYKKILEMGNFTQEELVKRMIRIVFVYTLISPFGWEIYDKYIVSFFKQGIDSLLYLSSITASL